MIQNERQGGDNVKVLGQAGRRGDRMYQIVGQEVKIRRNKRES